jgi:hypothetical protein
VARVVFETEAEGIRYLRNYDSFIHGVMCQKGRHNNAHIFAKLKCRKFIKYYDTRDVMCVSEEQKVLLFT